MDSLESLQSSPRQVYPAVLPTPVTDLPLTPPPTETSTPYQTAKDCPPQHHDLIYAAFQLRSGFRRHRTRQSEVLPPSPPTDRVNLPSSEDILRECGRTRSPISSPIFRTLEPLSWPTSIIQREAAKPPIVRNEKGLDTFRKFRRSIPTRIRA